MNDELKEAIKNNNVFDYVSNNYWKMNKEELRDIIKEYSYFIYNQGFKDWDALEDLDI